MKYDIYEGVIEHEPNFCSHCGQEERNCNCRLCPLGHNVSAGECSCYTFSENPEVIYDE